MPGWELVAVPGWEQAAIVLTGAFAGGFVSGLTGFGTGITAIGIWLHVLPPPVAASLVVVTSLVSQAQALPLIWGRVDWKLAAPFLIAGLAGVPVGTAALSITDPRAFKLGVGLFLVAYAAFALSRSGPAATVVPRASADALAGFLSGALGGLAGLSGPLMVIWTDLRGDAKVSRRMLVQTFSLTVLLAALIGHAVTGHLTSELGVAVLAALPGTLGGASLGLRLYKRLGERGYRWIVLCFLLASGLLLVATA